MSTPTVSNPEISVCPFCGETPFMFQRSDDGSFASVECDNGACHFCNKPVSLEVWQSLPDAMLNCLNDDLQRIKDKLANISMADGILDEIRELLLTLPCPCGKDHEHTPPMFYPEWIGAIVGGLMRDRDQLRTALERCRPFFESHGFENPKNYYDEYFKMCVDALEGEK